MFIEMQSDKIRLSRVFKDCQILTCVAERQKGGGSLSLCLQYMTFLEAEYLLDRLDSKGFE
jgi:hypothetical protein